MKMENENSCCFVAKIDEIKPILGADKIELAVLKGWQSIVQKGIHKVGDLVVCLTTDAVLSQEFSEKYGIISYLRKTKDQQSSDKEPKYFLRVRTVKLKNVYSECILMNLNIIPSKLGYHGDIAKYNPEGTDLMEKLDIHKYEEQVKQITLSSGRKIKYHQNPNFHVYYKFPNIKNVPGIFTVEDEVVITRKIHGTNARYGLVLKNKITLWDKIKQFFKRDPWWEYEYVYGSHNTEKGSDSQGFYDTDVWKDIAEKHNLKEKIWKLVKDNFSKFELGSGIIFYGEIYGPGIQKGYFYGLKEHKILFFDLKINGTYIPQEAFEFATIPNSFEIVEVLYRGKWSKEVQEQYSKPVLIEGSKMYHEGIVIKHISGNRKKIAKVVSQEYLIQNEKIDGTDFH